MPKWFVNPCDLSDGVITLQGDTAHHLVHVARVVPGDQIIVCDGACLDYHCSIKQISRKPVSLLLEIENTAHCDNEPDIKITLYPALIKGERMDWLIQKSVELGVHAIVPVITERTVARGGDVHKTERFQRIAESAAGQSMRGLIPQVYNPVSFNDAITLCSSHSFSFCAYEQEKNAMIKQLLTKHDISDIGIFIGPEGGFSKDEADVFLRCQIPFVSLGKRILRAETAALAVLTQVLCVLDVH